MAPPPGPDAPNGDDVVDADFEMVDKDKDDKKGKK